ncbi:hypothetical protein STENM36S_07775 [Streptomyces tendae]
MAAERPSYRTRPERHPARSGPHLPEDQCTHGCSRAPGRHLILLLTSAVALGGAWAAPASSAAPADIPPQEPGVTLRVFDVQTPLNELCTLKPGQTPNHDKLMPTVDWSSTADFGGIADNFAPRRPVTWSPLVTAPMCSGWSATTVPG